MGNAMGIEDEARLKAMAAELAKNVKSEKELGALTQQLVKLTVETALGAEMEEHLGYEKHDPAGRPCWCKRPRTCRNCPATWC